MKLRVVYNKYGMQTETYGKTETYYGTYYGCLTVEEEFEVAYYNIGHGGELNLSFEISISDMIELCKYKTRTLAPGNWFEVEEI